MIKFIYLMKKKNKLLSVQKSETITKTKIINKLNNKQ